MLLHTNIINNKQKETNHGFAAIHGQECGTGLLTSIGRKHT